MDAAPSELRQMREAAGLSIRELAERAGVAASTVWRIEAGRLDPTVGMLRRLLASVRPPAPSSPATREAAVGLTLGRLTASAVLRDPDELVAHARRRMAAVLADDRSHRGQKLWAAEWLRVLDGPLEEVVAALIDTGERGYELRQNTPFTGVFSDEERLAAVRRAAREHRAARSA